MPKYMSNTSLILEKLEELYDNLLLFGNTDTLIQYGSLFLKKGADNKWELGSVDASHIDGCFEIPAFISRIMKEKNVYIKRSEIDMLRQKL